MANYEHELHRTAAAAAAYNASLRAAVFFVLAACLLRPVLLLSSAVPQRAGEQQHRAEETCGQDEEDRGAEGGVVCSRSRSRPVEFMLVIGHLCPAASTWATFGYLESSELHRTAAAAAA